MKGAEPDPDRLPMEDCADIECRGGHGIVGDRYFDHKPNYIGQITFFDWKTYRDIQDRFSREDLLPSVFRRNVVTTGIDLNGLIGVEFELQGVRFCGTEEARPCQWMNRVIADGAKAALEGRGGLRARILSDGWLRVGPCDLQVLAIL